MWHKRAGTVLIEAGNQDFWSSLWKTEAFRTASQDPSHGLFRLMQEVVKTPWWLVPQSTDYERRHFTSWIGQVVLKRDYPEPAVNDLYWLHELLHGVTFATRPFLHEQDWRTAMRANEIMVSQQSEVLIYWNMPGLREQGFPFSIWWDEIQNGPSDELMQRTMMWAEETHQRHRLSTREENLASQVNPAHWFFTVPEPVSKRWNKSLLWMARRMISYQPDETNKVERDLAHYESQADVFFDHWKDHWQDVENHRLAFARLCAEGRYEEAIAQRHAQWESRANHDGIPYGDIALALSKKGF